MKDKIRLAFSRRQWMLTIAAIVIMILLFAWSKLSFAGKNRIIGNLEVEIDASKSGYNFLTKQAVVNWVQQHFDNPVGKPASEVELTKMEIELQKVPYVFKGIMYVGFDGTLKCRVKEREPIALIKNNQDSLFFIDTGGYMIPKRGIQTPVVWVINGNVKQKFESGKRAGSPQMVELVNLSKYIRSTELWNAQFEQCYVDKFGRYLLIPRVGKHSIVLDNTTNMEKKFENLRLFYEKGLPQVGWNTYREIDISYEDQIVGRRTEQ
jgi:cell division protein FtsQ